MRRRPQTETRGADCVRAPALLGAGARAGASAYLARPTWALGGRRWPGGPDPNGTAASRRRSLETRAPRFENAAGRPRVRRSVRGGDGRADGADVEPWRARLPDRFLRACSGTVGEAVAGGRSCGRGRRGGAGDLRRLKESAARKPPFLRAPLTWAEFFHTRGGRNVAESRGSGKPGGPGSFLPANSSTCPVRYNAGGLPAAYYPGRLRSFAVGEKLEGRPEPPEGRGATRSPVLSRAGHVVQFRSRRQPEARRESRRRGSRRRGRTSREAEAAEACWPRAEAEGGHRIALRAGPFETGAPYAEPRWHAIVQPPPEVPEAFLGAGQPAGVPTSIGGGAARLSLRLARAALAGPHLARNRGRGRLADRPRPSRGQIRRPFRFEPRGGGDDPDGSYSRFEGRGRLWADLLPAALRARFCTCPARRRAACAGPAGSPMSSPRRGGRGACRLTAALTGNGMPEGDAGADLLVDCLLKDHNLHRAWSPGLRPGATALCFESRWARLPRNRRRRAASSC